MGSNLIGKPLGSVSVLFGVAPGASLVIQGRTIFGRDLPSHLIYILIFYSPIVKDVKGSYFDGEEFPN